MTTTFAHRAPARRLPQEETRLEAIDDRRRSLQARIIAQIETALYPILITDESDPADQAKKRLQVAEAARAAWSRFSAL